MAVIAAVVGTVPENFVALSICKFTVGLKVSEQEERNGSDIVDHGESACN